MRSGVRGQGDAGALAVVGVTAAVFGIGVVWLGPVLLAVFVAAVVIAMVGSAIVGSDHRRLGAAVRGGLAERCGVAFLGAGLLTITWNAVRAGPGAALGDVFLVLAAVCCALLYLQGRHRAGKVPVWLILPSFAIALAAILGCIFGAPISNLVPGLRFAVAIGLTPLVIGFLTAHTGRFLLLIDVWLLSVLINGGIAVSDAFLGTGIGTRATGLEFNMRVSGLTVQPNHLAFVCAMALPVAFLRALDRQTPLLRAFHVTTCVVAVGALLVSGSRGASVAGLAGVVLIPLFRRQARARAFVALAAAAVAATVLVGSGGPLSGAFASIERLAGGGGSAYSTSLSDRSRAERRAEAVRNIREAPILGSGFDSITDAHNLYLQLLEAGGPLALAAFLLFAYGAIRRGVWLSRSPQVPPELQGIATSLTVAMLVWVGLAMVENQVFDRYLYIPAGFLVGVLFAVPPTATQPAVRLDRDVGRGSPDFAHSMS